MIATLKNTNTATKGMMATLALMTAAVVLPETAMAGAGGGEFDAVWTTLTDWMEGTLGKVAAGAMVLVGIIAGVARQNLMAFAIGIGGGVGLYNAPAILDNIVSATLEHAPAATNAVIAVSNGLGS